MTCFYPNTAWLSREVNENDKRPAVFNKQKADLEKPIDIPCNKCVGCKAQKAKIWGVRIHHEAQLHKQNCFVTLTYENNPLAINKRDLQLFFKRLRHITTFRYYACGEYGEKTRRPHYHAIIFGADFLHDAEELRDDLYTSKTLSDTWGQGHVAIGPVTIQSAMYTAGYVNKKMDDDDTFSIMSKRPPIGVNWLNKYRNDIINTGSVIIEDQRLPIPKLYLDKHPIDFQTVKEDREEYYRTRTPDQIWKTRTQIRAKEQKLKSRLNSRSYAL